MKHETLNIKHLPSGRYINDDENAKIFGTWTEYRNGRAESPHFDVSE